MSFDATKILGWKRRNGQGSHADAGRGAPATPSRKRARASRPSMEVLEDRIALATFFVVNSLDGPGSGPAGSLRSAIIQATQPGSGTNRVVITPEVTRPIDLTAGEIHFATSLAIENRSGREVAIRQT